MGTNSDGTANTSSVNITQKQYNDLEALSKTYSKNEEFKQFEYNVAVKNYFETPLLNFDSKVQNMIKSSDKTIQQVIMSTFVQYGANSNIAINYIKDVFKNEISNKFDGMIKMVSNLKYKYPDRVKIETKALQKAKESAAKQ